MSNQISTAVSAALPARVWSPCQTAIFDFIRNGVGNATVVAVAGSGKSTTIVEGMKACAGSTLFLAFNKSIATELQARGVNAKTFHSLCYSVVTRDRNVRTVESNKLRLIIDDTFPPADARAYSLFAAKLVGLARQAGFGAIVTATTDLWMALVDHHDLEVNDVIDSTGEYATVERGVELAEQLLAASNKSKLVDFDDLFYFAVKDGLPLAKFDFVFVDEAQDTNAIQRAILRKVMHPESRLIAVGDPMQAIYGFRGADSTSMDILAEEFNAIRLPLTVSYRCPTAVVNFAKRWVDHIEAAPSAREGTVTELGFDWTPSIFSATDLVVCRTTKPLVTLVYQLLAARVPAYIMGREIGAGLKSLVEKRQAAGIDRLIEKLETFTTREVEKALARRQEGKAESIKDKTECVMFLIETLPTNDRTIPALLRLIDSLFAEGAGKVTLATIHKAKGLEAKKVFWLNSSDCPSAWARQEWQVQQEMNLCYVATTRAQEELVLIEAPKKARPRS